MVSEEGIAFIADPVIPLAPKREEENLSDRHVARVPQVGKNDRRFVLVIRGSKCSHKYSPGPARILRPIP